MKVISITSPSISDGLGCRVVVWFAGCKHQCPGCQNKWTWNYNQGDELNVDTITKIFHELNKPYIKGITLSGGDPLDQQASSLMDLYYFVRNIKSEFSDKDIWIYSGDTYEKLIKDDIKKQILDLCDVLVDGPFVLKEKDVTIGFRGSRNQRIIDLNKTRKKNKVYEIAGYEI